MTIPEIPKTEEDTRAYVREYLDTFLDIPVIEAYSDIVHLIEANLSLYFTFVNHWSRPDQEIVALQHAKAQIEGIVNQLYRQGIVSNVNTPRTNPGADPKENPKS